MLSKQIEIRGLIRYSIRYRTRSSDLTKESRSIDRAENLTELKGVLTQKVELKSRSLRTRITSKPVPRSLTEKGSVRGRSLQSSSSTGSTRIRISLLCSCSLRTDRPGFFEPIISSLNNQVMKFPLLSTIWTSLEG